jgi:hypothetical protein
MPQTIYTVHIDGTEYDLEGDHEPTEAEARQAIGKPASAPPARPDMSAAAVPAVDAPSRTWTDTAIDSLPMVGGAVGGILGGLSGLPTFGLTAGPGAIVGAGVLGGAGEAAKQSLNRWRGKYAPTTSLEAAKDIGIQGGIQAGSELAGQAIVKGLSTAGRSLYRGFLKPSLAKPSLGKAGQVVETGLEEALPVTKAGEGRAWSLIDMLRGKVDDALARAPGEVDLGSVADRVRAAAKSEYFKPGKPLADFEAALKVAEEIDAHPALANPFNPTSAPTATASGANAIKRGIYKTIGETNYGVERGATKTAQKIAASALREDIEGLTGGAAGKVAQLNARESKLIDVAKSIARAVGREENKSPLIGVNTLLSGAVGGARYANSGDPYEAAAWALASRAALTPAVATRVAIVAYKLGKASPEIPANIARIALAAVLEAQGKPGKVQGEP